MKISKTAVLIGGFLTTGLGLTMGAIDLYKDPSYAVQHISDVKIIESGNAVSSTVKHTENLVNVETDNFILSKDKDSNKIITGIYSSILGGSGNTITGDYSVIVGGENNKIEGGVGNSILGGMENNLKTGENSVIIGGENNVLEGNYSSIVGGTSNTVNGDYLVVVGNNSHVTGSYSVVMGQNSNLNANSSFLWTDGGHAGTFTTDNVFAVIASGGMVINAKSPHNDYTQLTLGGPLVLSENIEENDSIICSGGQGGGIVKVVNSGDKVCMCSCDGYERSSLFGLGTCRSVCNPDIKPKCNTGISKHWDTTGQYNYYSGGCDSGTVVDGAYFVDKYNVIHWSCQSDDGAVLECTGSDIMGGGYEGCGGIKPTGEHIERGPSTGVNNNVRAKWVNVSSRPNKPCLWKCENGYIQSGNTCVLEIYSCQGNYPSNAVKTGSSVYYTGNYKPNEWTETLFQIRGVLQPCKFMCGRNYFYDRTGNTCVDLTINPIPGELVSIDPTPYVKSNCYTGSIPAKASLNNKKEPETKTTATREIKEGDGSTNNPCTFDCNEGFEYKNGDCLEKKEYTKCNPPEPPVNSCTGHSEYPPSYDTTGRTYTKKPCNELKACEWTCKEDYNYENGKCNPVGPKPQPGVCTGDMGPGGVRRHPEIEPPTGTEIEYKYSLKESRDPCVYYCARGYYYNGEKCVADNLTDLCDKNTRYECLEGGMSVNETSEYSNGKIIFKWDCQIGDYTQNGCYKEERLKCKHCAINGFDYCFPIDFSENCSEVEWWLKTHN